MKILIVEDDQSAAKLIKKKIKALGHPVEVAGNGKSALSRVKQIFFDLVLLDLILPDYHGADLIPQFKSIQHDMGIIVMTGHNSRELELKIRRLGVSFYLIKPFDLSFLETILSHISNKKTIAAAKISEEQTGHIQTENKGFLSATNILKERRQFNG